MTAKPEDLEELELKLLELELQLLCKAPLKLIPPPLAHVKLFPWVQYERTFTSHNTNVTNDHLLTLTSLGNTLALIFH